MKNYLLKSTLWTIFFFLLWWYLIPMIMPFAATIVSPMLNNSFDSRYGAQIEVNGSEWILATTLYLNRPKDGKVKAWYARIGDLTRYTMGLPLLLGFFVAIKKFHYMRLLVATLILSSVIIVLMWGKVSLMVWSLLTDDSVEYIKIYSGYYQQVKNYPVDIYHFFSILHSSIVHIVAFLLPVLLVYWFNKDFYHYLFRIHLKEQSISDIDS